jgi:hypothetical protein
MDEKIDVEFCAIPRQDVCFGAVEVEIALDMTAKLVYDFATYYGAKSTEAGEITRIPGSPDSVFKKIPILEKLNPDMDYVAREEEQLNQDLIPE